MPGVGEVMKAEVPPPPDNGAELEVYRPGKEVSRHSDACNDLFGRFGRIADWCGCVDGTGIKCGYCRLGEPKAPLACLRSSWDNVCCDGDVDNVRT